MTDAFTVKLNTAFTDAEEKQGQAQRRLAQLAGLGDVVTGRAPNSYPYNGLIPRPSP
jgi:hypothetical protein